MKKFIVLLLTLFTTCTTVYAQYIPAGGGSGGGGASDQLTVSNDSVAFPGSYQLKAGANITLTPVVGPPNTLTIASSGGSASAGGTNTQIQWNNGGALSGFTASGGATINTATGVVTLGNPSTSTLGGIKSLAAVTSNWINAISTSGVPTATQPAFTDISGSITLAQFPTEANNTVLGNVSGGSAVPVALTATQLTTIPNVFTSGLQGMAPASGGGTTNFLRADGTWAAPGGGGGAVSSVSNSDGTLTISPTTGAVVASLALGHANTWTGQQTFGTSAPIFSTTTATNILFAGTSGILSTDQGFNFITNGSGALASSYIVLNSGNGSGIPGYIGAVVLKQIAISENAYFNSSNWAYGTAGFASAFRFSDAGALANSGYTINLAPSASGTITGFDSTCIAMLGIPGSVNQQMVNPGTTNPTFGTVQAFGINPNNTADNLAEMQVNAISATHKPLVVQGASSQSGNLLEAQNSSGTLQAYIDSNGSVREINNTYVTSNISYATSVMANVTGLTANVKAGGTYSFEANLYVTADAVGGHRYAINGTATATNVIYQINSISNTSNAFVINSQQTSLGTAVGQSGATSVHTKINGTIVVNAAGTLTVQFAQSVANATSTVLAGSSFILNRLN